MLPKQLRSQAITRFYMHDTDKLLLHRLPTNMRKHNTQQKYINKIEYSAREQPLHTYCLNILIVHIFIRFSL